VPHSIRVIPDDSAAHGHPPPPRRTAAPRCRSTIGVRQHRAWPVALLPAHRAAAVSLDRALLRPEQYAAGLLMSVFFVVSCFGQALAGFVVDRFGAARVLYGGLALLGLAALGLGASPSYAVMLVFMAVRLRQLRLPCGRLLHPQRSRQRAAAGACLRGARHLGQPRLGTGAGLRRRHRHRTGIVRLALFSVSGVIAAVLLACGCSAPGWWSNQHVRQPSVTAQRRQLAAA